MPKHSQNRHRALAGRVFFAYEVIVLTYTMVVIATEGLEAAVRPVVLAVLGGLAFAFFRVSRASD
jgi:hypothetical protein